MPRSVRTLLTLASGLWLLELHLRLRDHWTLLRLQRSEMNCVRSELHAHARLLGVDLPPSPTLHLVQRK